VDKYGGIPQELKDRRIWMLWLNEQGTKVPYRTGGTRGSSTDPSAWTIFESVCRQEELYTGIAIAIAHPYTGIDLDGCLDSHGLLADWAAAIVEEFRGVAYCEISPSGTGLKLITRARKPDGAKCVAKMGEGKCQVEIYDHGRFWAMTGRVWAGMDSIGDGSEALRRLCERLWGRENPVERIQAQSLVSSGSLIDSARAYVANVPGATKGSLRDSAFRLSGHLHAFVSEDHERLDDHSVLQLLREWNQRNSPPLKDKELEEAAVNGRKNGSPPADKVVHDGRVRQITKIDVDQYAVEIDLDSAGTEPTSQKESEQQEQNKKTLHRKPGRFPYSLAEAPGIIGELVEHNLRTAHYPLPELALAGALALISTLCGRKVIDYQRTRPNMMILGLAPSGGGKDWARVLNAEILQGCGGENMVGPERIGSHAGIITQMEAEPVTLFQIDEIGHMVAAMQQRTSPHLFQISSVLMQLYSSSGRVWMADALGDRQKVKRLYYPSLTLYGTSVPDGFWQRLTEENLTGGLIGRCCVFEAPEYVRWHEPATDNIPDQILDRALAWIRFQPHAGDLAGTAVDGSSPKLVMQTEEARQRLNDHTMAISDKRIDEDTIDAAIWSRTAEKTRKLALLFACSRFDGTEWPTIQREDADRAIKLNNFLTRRMLWQAQNSVAETDFHRNLNYVQKILTDAGGKWVSLGQITQRTRRLSPRERRDVLQHLIQEEAVEAVMEDTGGRPRQKFRKKNS
jgi:hypothetical protein